MNYKNINLLY